MLRYGPRPAILWSWRITTALPAALRQALTGLQVPVNGLPQGLTLTSAEVVPAGVHVTLTGDDVVAPAGATPTP